MKEDMIKFTRIIEKGIIYALILMMSVILLLATIELGYFLIHNILRSGGFLIDLDSLLDLFGVILMVLIGIELLDTIKVYLKESLVHVEVIMLVAIIALARKIVVLKVDQLDGEELIGIGILIIALSIAYYLIKKAGLFVFNVNGDEEEVSKDSINKKTPGK